MARDSKRYGYKFLLWEGEDPADQLKGFEGTIFDDGYVAGFGDFVSPDGTRRKKGEQIGTATKSFEAQFSQWTELVNQLAPGDHVFLDSLARRPLGLEPYFLIKMVVIDHSASLSFAKDGFEFSPDTIADNEIWKFLKANRQAQNRERAETRIRWIKSAAKDGRYKNNGRKKEISRSLVMDLLAEGLKPEDFKAAKGWSKASIFRIKKEFSESQKGREWVPIKDQLQMLARLREALVGGTVKNFSDWLRVLENEFPDVIAKGQIFWAKEFHWKDLLDPETGVRFLDARVEQLKVRAEEINKILYRHGPPSFDPDRGVYLVNEGLTEDQICEIMGLADSGPLYFFLAMKKYEGPFIETANGKAGITKAREMIKSMGLADVEDGDD